MQVKTMRRLRRGPAVLLIDNRRHFMKYSKSNTLEIDKASI